MIRALVTDDPDGQGVRLSVVHQLDDATRPHEILRIIGDENGIHHFRWQELTLDAMIEPTLQIPPEMARALYEALARHFQGTGDTRALPALTGRDT
jgi:hypothetical protein